VVVLIVVSEVAGCIRWVGGCIGVGWGMFKYVRTTSGGLGRSIRCMVFGGIICVFETGFGRLGEVGGVGFPFLFFLCRFSPPSPLVASPPPYQGPSSPPRDLVVHLTCGSPPQHIRVGCLSNPILLRRSSQGACEL